MLIKHLLTYTLDGYGLASLGNKTPHELTEYIMTHDFVQRPGTVFKYTNIPAFLLGLVVEKIYGETLDHIADKEFFQPLGMQSTTFFPERLDQSLVAPTEVDKRGLVQGVVHDESAYIFKQQGSKIVGHAGLFSNANDILTFLEMLLNYGTYNNRQYFSHAIVKEMYTNQIADIGQSNGLGWELNQARYMGKYCSENSFGKTGFTGTVVVVDIPKGTAYTILSNRTYPLRQVASTDINQFRADIGDIILE